MGADNREADEELRPEGKTGRRDFPLAWAVAANEGLISDEEYVTELLRHTRAENERTMPYIDWSLVDWPGLDDENDPVRRARSGSPPRRSGALSSVLRWFHRKRS